VARLSGAKPLSLLPSVYTLISDRQYASSFILDWALLLVAMHTPAIKGAIAAIKSVADLFI
jgi:hypothetical protein